MRERYKVERKFGEAKGAHGLARCRYLGLVRYAVQGYLTAMVLNLKRLVKLLWGGALPEPAPGGAQSHLAAAQYALGQAAGQQWEG